MIDVLGRLAVDFGRSRLSSSPIRRSRSFASTATRDSAATSRRSRRRSARIFRAARFARNEGAGLYFEIAPGWVWIGGGMYMPSTCRSSGHPQPDRSHSSAAASAGGGAAVQEGRGRADRRTADARAQRLLQGSPCRALSAVQAVHRRAPSTRRLSPRAARFYSELLRVFKAVIRWSVSSTAPARCALRRHRCSWTSRRREIGGEPPRFLRRQRRCGDADRRRALKTKTLARRDRPATVGERLHGCGLLADWNPYVETRPAVRRDVVRRKRLDRVPYAAAA